jgi:hypothetical protein
MNVSYADKLEELQRLRTEVRRLERLAEAEAKRMQPLTEHQERQMYADQSTFDQAYMVAGRKAPPLSRDAQLSRITEVIRQRPVPQPMRTGF